MMPVKPDNPSIYVNLVVSNVRRDSVPTGLPTPPGCIGSIMDMGPVPRTREQRQGCSSKVAVAAVRIQQGHSEKDTVERTQQQQ